MSSRIVARWQTWSGDGMEHLVLDERPGEILAEAAIIGAAGDEAFAARYRIQCDGSWRARKIEIAQIGNDRLLALASDGAGKWVDKSNSAISPISGAIDVDISITPFTNTLPIRRLNLQKGQSAEILAVYIQVPGLAVTTAALYVPRARKPLSIRVAGQRIHARHRGRHRWPRGQLSGTVPSGAVRRARHRGEAHRDETGAAGRQR